MNKKVIVLLSFFFSILALQRAAAQDFPIKEWAAATHDKPLIFYISGDGGFNKFSTQLCQAINKKGYDVVSLNAKSYFGSKKTPEQTTIAINNYIFQKLAGRANEQVALIGYSFGADVIPFIINRLPQSMQSKVVVAMLIASSGTTDFETHWSDMLGGNTKRSMDVISELNKINETRIVIMHGSDDNDLDMKKLTLKKYVNEALPGGHHFDGDTEQVANAILKYAG